MSTAQRFRIRERYWTIQEIAKEAGITFTGAWSRVKAGRTGESLLQRVPDKATTKIERAMRRRLTTMLRAKYKRTCPNCGHCFDMFQPAHMLKTIKPGL